MNLDEFVAVSGEGGLFKLKASKQNGLVLESIDTGKSKFYSMRKHNFTPLGTVAIYTLEDTSPLQDVFKTMLDKHAALPPVSPKAENHIIEEYFEQILPDYDEDRVYVKDMKKVIKWYNFLKERNLLDSGSEEEE